MTNRAQTSRREFLAKGAAAAADRCRRALFCAGERLFRSGAPGCQRPRDHRLHRRRRSRAAADRSSAPGGQDCRDQRCLPANGQRRQPAQEVPTGRSTKTTARCSRMKNSTPWWSRRPITDGSSRASTPARRARRLCRKAVDLDHCRRPRLGECRAKVPTGFPGRQPAADDGDEPVCLRVGAIGGIGKLKARPWRSSYTGAQALHGLARSNRSPRATTGTIGRPRPRPGHSTPICSLAGCSGEAYSGGEMTNWGAHGVDQIQWALGMSHPVRSKSGPHRPVPNGKVRMKYDNGVVVRYELKNGPHGGADLCRRGLQDRDQPQQVHDQPAGLRQGTARPGRAPSSGKGPVGSHDRTFRTGSIASRPASGRMPTSRSATARSRSATWRTSPARSAASCSGIPIKRHSLAMRKPIPIWSVQGARGTSCRKHDARGVGQSLLQCQVTWPSNAGAVMGRKC